MNFEHINHVAHNVTFLYPLKYGKTSLCCDFSVYRNITFGTNRLSTLDPTLRHGSINSDLFARLPSRQNPLMTFSKYRA